MNIILIALAIRHLGNWDKIFEALEAKEKVSLAELREVEEMLKKSDDKVITILDQEYPQELKNIYKPPFCLWVKGEVRNLRKNFMAVGGNQSDKTTLKRVKKFIPELEGTYTLISPNFAGIDTEIIKEGKNRKLFILACGFSRYEKFNDLDVYISEYPPRVAPSKEGFRQRNRIIAGFGEALILFSSLRDGKINHLVSEFLNMGKEIFAFPGDGLENDGNSELIKQGANLITSIKDLKTN